MKTLLIIAGILLLGCSSPTPKYEEFDITGTVRNVWAFGCCYDVVFEHDNGISQTIRFANHPPVWAGDHVLMHVRKACDDGRIIVCGYADETLVELKTHRLQ